MLISHDQEDVRIIYMRLLKQCHQINVHDESDIEVQSLNPPFGHGIPALNASERRRGSLHPPQVEGVVVPAREEMDEPIGGLSCGQVPTGLSEGMRHDELPSPGPAVHPPPGSVIGDQSAH